MLKIVKTGIGKWFADELNGLQDKHDRVARRCIANEIGEYLISEPCSYDERHELEALRIEALSKPKR
jgi:hypothetical protein